MSDVSSVVSSTDSNAEDETAANDLQNSDIVTKYRCAADIANKTLQHMLQQVKPGTKAVTLCDLGQDFITQETDKVYNAKKNGKKIEKGCAFPVCVSVNNCVGHYSPLRSEDDVVLQAKDIVKIDLGVHVDGYIAVVAETAVCGGEPVSDTRAADAMVAAHTAAELCHRMFKQGCTNSEITAMIQKVADDFDCTPVEGVLSHQMKKHVIDANKVVMNKETIDQQVKECQMELGDVFGFDIVMSTGKGKPKQSGKRTTVFKRDLEEKYSLKMKASRTFFHEVNQRFPTLPFSLRAGDEKAWRMGVVECVKNGLFIEYPVLEERAEEVVAQVKFTALLLPSGRVVRITQGSKEVMAKSNKSLKDEKLVALLSESVEVKKKDKKKKK